MDAKIVIFPNPHVKSSNPYLFNLSYAIDAINKKETIDSNILNLVKHLYDGDVYIFNWPETLIFRKYGVFQGIIFILCLSFLRFRNVKIVWIFHNTSPHEGHNWYTEFIYKLFFKISNLIITHSKDALNYIKTHTSVKSIYLPHPFKKRIKEYNPINNIEFDVIIWGSIIKYKGIIEYLRAREDFNKDIRTLIVGKCNDPVYDNQIRQLIDASTVYRNEYLDYDELENLICKSRFVVLPYLKDSISSSGALMDSLFLGKTVIGPNVGAFKELAGMGLCYTFNEHKEIFELLNRNELISPSLIYRYVDNNTWIEFGRFLKEILNEF